MQRGPELAAAPLDARRRALIAFALKLTRTPDAMRRDDVAALRAVGLDDRDVLGLVECVAYYAYANRIADGLGLALEEATLNGGPPADDH